MKNAKDHQADGKSTKKNPPKTSMGAPPGSKQSVIQTSTQAHRVATDGNVLNSNNGSLSRRSDGIL